MKNVPVEKLETTCNLFPTQGRPVGVGFKRFTVETTAGIYSLGCTVKAPCHHIRQKLVHFLSYLMLPRGLFLENEFLCAWKLHALLLYAETDKQRILQQNQTCLKPCLEHLD